MSKSKLLATVSALAVSLAAVPAQAHDHSPMHRWYVSGFLGISIPQDHEFSFVSNTTGAPFKYVAPLDNGFAFGGALGIIINKNVRAEIEVAHSSFDFVNTYRGLSTGFIGQNPVGGIDVTTVMANLWFNTQIGSVMPYIGGGVGIGVVDGNLRITNGSGAQFGGDDTALAFQGGLGLRIPVSGNFEFDLGYRLKGVHEVNFTSAIPGFRTTDDTLIMHTFQAGVTVKF